MASFQEWLYPELKHIPAKADRRVAMWAFQPHFFRSWQCWLLFALAIPFGVMLPWMIRGIAQVLPGAPGFTGRMVQSMVAGAIQRLTFAFVFNYAFRKRVRRFLREHLNERGFHLCLACGYDLRGQTTPRCPECGTAFDPGRIEATRVSE